MKLIVRRADESDAMEIHSVSRHLGYGELSEQESIQKLHDLLLSPIDEVYVAVLNYKIVGWLHLFFSRRLASDNFHEIGGLVVLPEMRGKGIGRLLVESSIEGKEGKIRVRCNDKRKESHEFYEAIGFECAKLQRVFQGRS